MGPRFTFYNYPKFLSGLFVWLLIYLVGCVPGRPIAALSVLGTSSLLSNRMIGDTEPVHDPSVIFQDGTYYLFSSDTGDAGARRYLPVRCSSDRVVWLACGQVFATIPAWVKAAVPGIGALWAPDISYF